MIRYLVQVHIILKLYKSRCHAIWTAKSINRFWWCLTTNVTMITPLKSWSTGIPIVVLWRMYLISKLYKIEELTACNSVSLFYKHFIMLSPTGVIPTTIYVYVQAYIFITLSEKSKVQKWRNQNLKWGCKRKSYAVATWSLIVNK